MNRAGFRARIRGLLGDAEPTGNPRFSDSLLDGWVDDEVTELGGEAPWAFNRSTVTVTTVADQASYELPEGTLRVDYVADPSGRRIDFLNEFEYTDIVGSGGTPTAEGYTIPLKSPATLTLAKVPDAPGDITVHCFMRTPMPADDTTDLPLPQEFWDVVIYRVASKCATRDRNLELVALFASEADGLIRKIAHTQRGTRTSELQQITLLRASMSSRRI